MDLFAQITKVDVAKREVWGRAAQEVPDHSGEILDYATSKAYFQEWSDEIASVTKGKSLGNIRSMHSNVAAGKMISMSFNDADKAIDIGTKIVDDNEWEKVLEGVHTGFSIGGSYVSKWDDGELTRYTAKPSEISLVDRPCIPTALFFDVVKQDGSVIQKAFKSQPKDTNVNPDTKKEQDAAVDALAELVNKGSITMPEVLELAKARVASSAVQAPQADATAKPGAVHKAEGAGGASDEMPTGADTNNTDTMRVGQDDTRNETGDNGTTAAYPKVGEPVSFAWGDARSQGTIKDVNGGIAVVTAGLGEFTVAVSYLQAAEGQGQNGSPMWDVNLMDGPAAKSFKVAELAKAVRVAMKKGMYGVANFASILQTICYLQEDCSWEAEYEADGSTLPADIKAWMAQGGALLVAMVQEEVSELAGGEDVDADDLSIMMLSEHGGLLAKVGARNSSADMAKIQGIHDHASDLGALCTDSSLDDIINAPIDDATSSLDDSDFFDSNAMMMADKSGTLKKAMRVAKSVAPTLRKQLKETNDKLGVAHEDIAKLKTDKETLEKRIKELEALPAAGPAVLKSIGKESDVVAPKENEVAPVRKHTGEEDAVATALKKVHAQGGTHLNRI